MIGEKANPNEFPLEETQRNDNHIFSYTSGTTGDSKGVKLTNRMIMMTVECVLGELTMVDHTSTIISYLPYPHGFE